jgi:hypothetical protein
MATAKLSFHKIEITECRRIVREMESLAWRLRSKMITPWPGDIERVEAELARQKGRLRALLEPADGAKG